jgi:phage baseplate assembly protein W
MAQKGYINIQFPFQDDPDGKFLKMNDDVKLAIKADLLHLLLTNKGERLYMPDFGANLRQYLFEQNDNISYDAIKNEINDAVRKYIPNLTVNAITPAESEDSIHAVVIKIEYTVTTGAFQSNDSVTLKL